MDTNKIEVDAMCILCSIRLPTGFTVKLFIDSDQKDTTGELTTVRRVLREKRRCQEPVTLLILQFFVDTCIFSSFFYLYQQLTSSNCQFSSPLD